MTPHKALAIVEGLQPADELQQLHAWQFLVASGLAWTLPGRIGRMAQALIEAGELVDPREALA